MNEFVYVEWRDIMADDNHWLTTEGAIEWAENVGDIVQQAGHVIADEEDYIVLGNKLIPHKDDFVSIHSGVTKIPKANIIKMIKLPDYDSRNNQES
jgi:hypothetical protein